MFSIYTTEGAIFSARSLSFMFAALAASAGGIRAPSGSFSARNLRKRPTGIANP